MRWKRHLLQYGSLYLSGLLLIGLGSSYFLFPDFQSFVEEGWQILGSKDRTRITAWFAKFGWWGPLLIIAFMVLQMFLIVFPTWLPMIVAVLGYGPVKGVLISVAAVFVASVVGYFVGERLGRPLRKNVIGEQKYLQLSTVLQTYGFWGVVLFRISPFLSNDAVSFIAGMMKMGFRRYLAATMVGIVPLAVAIGYFGKDTDSLRQGLYWISGAGVFFYLLYIYVRSRQKRLPKGEE